jgi:ABC-type uncharacterized transport system involved in gliding motility auxiliary subunit
MALMAPKNTNKSPNSQYAFIGLIIALVACIATALLGAAKGMLLTRTFTLDASQENTLNLALQIGIALLVLGLAYYAIMSPDSIRRFFTGRQARYGSNAFILALAFLGILLTINYLVYKNPGTPLDLTEDKSNTLSKESLEALATLPEKVNAIGFYSARIDSSSAREMLEKFKVNSNGKFDYEFIDPDQNPVAARDAGITGDGKILLVMGESKELVTSASENELTRTMIRLINPSERAVYFLEGHGEGSLEPTSQDEISYSTAQFNLTSKNYTVKSLNLLATNKIPEDALAIIIAGPLKPVSAEEVNLLKKYVDGGGSLVVMENPNIITEFGEDPDPLAAYLEKDWGIMLNDDLIFDQSSDQVFYAISASLGAHPITQDMTYIVVMPNTRSLSLSPTPIENVISTSLIQTSEQSWGETDLSGDTGQYQYDPAVDFTAPLTMAAAAENGVTSGRVVVMGNSLFASDQFFDAYGNSALFINSVDWAAEQENLINITPRDRIPRTMNRPISGLGLISMLLLSVFVIPGIIIFLGVSSWIARRRRG